MRVDAPPGEPDAKHPWPGLEVRHLAALAAVRREGSFRAAADALGYVQSAVSQQIAMLERIVGARLVERSRGQRGVELTPAGELVVEHGADVIDRLHAARADLAALTEDSPAIWRVAVELGIGGRLVPALVDALARRSEPPVELSEVSDPAVLAERLRTGILDLTIGSPVPPRPSLAFEHLLDDPYVLLVPEDSPLAAGEEAPTLAELAELPLIGVLAPAQVDELRESAAARGLALELTLRLRNAAAAWALVTRGRGVAIGPRSALDLGLPGVVAIGLEQALPSRPIVLGWHRERLATSDIECVLALVRRAATT